MFAFLLAMSIVEPPMRFELDRGVDKPEQVTTIDVETLPSIISLRQVGLATPDWPASPCIVLANGDCVAGTFGEGPRLPSSSRLILWTRRYLGRFH